MRGLSGLALALLLAMPAAAAPPGVRAAPPPGMSVQGAWMRYLLPGIPAGGYLVLRNGGTAPAVLTGASSPACGSLMLHESAEASGMAMMRTVPGIAVPAGGSVALAPGGYHLMCMAPKMKPGESVSVTLRFEDGSSLTVAMPVYGPGGPPVGSAAGSE